MYNGLILSGIILGIGVRADYMMFGGDLMSADMGLKGAYEYCRTIAPTTFSTITEKVFPYLARARELADWDDNTMVRTPDGRLVYSSFNFRTIDAYPDDTKINSVLTSFGGTRYWPMALTGLGQVQAIKFYSGFTGGGWDAYVPFGNSDASSSTCNNWTSTSSAVYHSGFSYYHPDNYWTLGTVFPCDTPHRLLCLMDMPYTETPSVSPTPPTSLPTKSPTKSPTFPTSSPTRSPTGFVTSQEDPIIDYSFSQQGCKEGRWDFDDEISFTRMLNATSCYHDEEEGFQYWGNGAYNTRVDGEEYMDAFSSSVITNQLDSITPRNPEEHGLRFSNMTFMIWVTRLEPWPQDINFCHFLMDIGPSTWHTDEESVTFSICAGYHIAVNLVNYRDSSGAVDAIPTNLYGTDYGARYPGNYAYFPTIALAVRVQNRFGAGSTRGVSVLGWQGFDRNATRWSFDIEDSPLGPFVLHDESKIRFNTYRYSYPHYYKGLNGTVIHRVAMWSRYMEEDELSEEARYGMPRSFASCRNTTVELSQGYSMEFSLNTSNFVRDFDNDTIKVIRVFSLPSIGKLMHGETRFTQQDLPLLLTDANSTLTYVPENNLTWSYPNCSGTEFRFDASDDGMNFSLGETYAKICIRELNRAPVVVERVFSLPRGSTLTFKIEATDYNDHTIPPSSDLGLMDTSNPGEFRNTSTVSFLIREGDFGGLFLDDCSTPLATEESYHLSTEFCYVSTKTNDQQGIDEFNVTVSDAITTSLSVAIQFNNTNPLAAPGETIILEEHPFNASFELPLFDGLDRGFTLVAQIVSIPSHGTLRFEANQSMASIGDLVEGNLTYQPNKYFFTRTVTGAYTNFYGEPLPPPDTFSYLVKDKVNGSVSEPGMMYFNITSTMNEIQSVSGLDEPIQMTFGTPYKFGTRIQITDPDNEQYRVGAYFYTVEGEFVCDINQTELKVIGPNQHSLLLSPCGLTMDDGCSELYLAARPRYVNDLLTRMSLVLTQSRTSYTRVNVRFYKPGPDGITPANFENEILYGGPQISAKLSLIVNGTETSPNGGGGGLGDTILFLIMPFLLLLTGFSIVCSPCLTACLCYGLLCTRWYRLPLYLCSKAKQLRCFHDKEKVHADETKPLVKSDGSKKKQRRLSAVYNV